MRKERIVFDYRHYFLRSVVFLYYHLGENGFLILLGVVTGLVTGVGAGAMKLGAARLSEFAPYLREHGWLLPALLLPAAGLAGAFLLGRSRGSSTICRRSSPKCRGSKPFRIFSPAP